MWIRGVGNVTSVDGTGGAPGFSVDAGGFLPGYDRAVADYAHDWMRSERRISGIGTASESHGGEEATFAGQWRLPFVVPGLSGGTAAPTPKVGIQYTHLSETGFADSGASGFDPGNDGRSAARVFVFLVAGRKRRVRGRRDSGTD